MATPEIMMRWEGVQAGIQMKRKGRNALTLRYIIEKEKKQKKKKKKRKKERSAFEYSSNSCHWAWPKDSLKLLTLINL